MAQRRLQHFLVFTTFSLYDRTLTNIRGWHVEEYLQKMVCGSDSELMQ